MTRVGAILIFAAAVLVSTHMLAPAEPPAAPFKDAAALRAEFAQSVPIAAQIDAEVERLRKRLESRPQYPPPTRDPFRYGSRPEPRDEAPADDAPAVITPAPAPPPVPQLVAIATSKDGSSTRTAVLALGDHVQVVKPGDVFGAFAIRAIAADAVELLEAATGRVTTISLR